jgi:hypothetical protein
MQVELGPLVFSLVFWIGMGVLLAAAVALRYCATPLREKSRPGPAGAPDAAAPSLVHRIARGRVRLSIWATGGGERGASRRRHQVRVDRRGPDCGDCMDCVNEALHWIRDHEAPG